MRLLRDTSISRKLKVVILATTSVALLIASAAFVTYDLVAFRQSMASDLSTLAKVIGTNSTAALAFNHRASAKDVLSALTAKQNVVRARIYTSDSDLFAEYVGAGESGDIALTVQQQSQVAFTNGYLIASETIDLDGETIGTVYLISNLDAFRSRLNRFAGVVAAVLFGSLLVAFLLSSKLQSQISDPISHLAKTARNVSVNKDYTIRAVKSGRDEMGMLIDAFNEMLGQIQERDVKLQSARDELEQRVEERTKKLQDEIAERKQAVELLRRSEEHFRSLIENASDVITIIDSKGTILYESPSVERVLGLKPQTLVGKNAFSLAHQDDRKTAVALFTAATDEGSPAGPFELRFQHADGSWRSLEVIGQATRNAAGAMETIINSRDVTERRRSDAALRESEEKYRTILESIQEGYYEVDLRGCLTFFNSSLSRIVGTPAERMMGLSHREYTDPETARRLEQVFGEVLQTGVSLKEYRYEITTLEGVHSFLETSVSLRRDTDGKITGFHGMIRDFTERNRAEEALKESERRYRALFESNPQPMWVYSTETLSFLAVNDAAVDSYGYSREEFVAMSIKDIRPQEDVANLLQSVRNASAGFEASGSWRHRKKDGSIIDAEVSSHGLNFGGAEARLVLATDVTERKRAIKELRDSELKYRTLFNQIADPVVIFDKATNRFLDCNEAVRRNYGYSVEELRTMSVFDLHPPEDLPKVERYIEVGNPDHPNIDTHITKDGRRIDVEILTDEIDYQGRPCWISIVRDITQRKRTEDKLLRLATAVEQTGDIIVITGTDGNIQYVNPAFEQTTGYSSDEVLGKNPRFLKSGESSIEFYRNLWETITQGDRWTGHFTNKRKDGSLYEEDATISPVRDVTGKIVNYVAVKRDITERRKMEKEVTMLAHAIRSIHDTVSITDPNDNVLFVNEAFLETYGYTYDEVIGKNIRQLARRENEFDHPDMPSPESIVSLRWEGELINRRKDGTEFPVQLSASPILDEDGRTIALIGVARDITERKRAEQALRESEERYRAVSETATDGIITIDHESKITYLNRAAERLFGYSSAEIVGQPITRLMPERLRNSHQTFLQRYVKTGSQHLVSWQAVVVPIRHKSGKEIPVELSIGESIHNDKRNFTGIVRDITERRKMEKEVRMLAQAVRSIHESVVIADPDGNIIFVNAAAVEVYGYEPDEVIGKHVSIFHPTGDSPEFANEIVCSASAGDWEGDMLSRRKDGTEFPIHLSATPIRDEKGQSIAFIGVSQDITERKRSIEELQKAKEAAEAASLAKSEFLANMSHEIRTPMNGIVGMTELALDTELTDEQREYLKLVKLSSDALLRVINDILDFSKIEAGRLELDHAEFSLQDNVDEVMKALAVRADQKGLELAYYLRPGVPDLIVGDSGRLQQILINLVGNAIKFTERGEVVVRIETESQTDDQVILHFCVRDTGIGVPIEKQALVFESFTQADGSTTRKYGGTGLGLAISTQLVRAMDGQIWIQSPSTGGLSNSDSGLENCPSDRQSEMNSVNPAIDGPGSMFHFTAAFALPRTSSDRTAPLEFSTLRGLPALVVDDNATNRRILEVQLTGWGMIPTTAENAGEALDAIRATATGAAPFSLALLDLHMPGVDGLELTERIRRMPEAADVKIVMMSSALRENYRKQDLGVDAYLMKPVKASDLLGVIRSVLRKAAVSQNGSGRPRAISSAHPAHVLVAEDSAVNQELIKRLLAKWGHSVVIADNGKQALALLETGSFDLVLMDVQMPEINGFEATAAIRSKERGTDAHIPIIALTARALKGDREKCIAAGMDGYISKPVQADKAFDAIEAAIARGRISNNNGHAPPRALDADALMLNLDGDIELLRELAKIFATSAPIQLSEIDDAIARQDAEGLARGAHTLKGSVATFQARAAVDAAAMLEKIGDSGDLSNANPALEALSLEIARVTQALHELTGGEVK